eukprot:gene19804-22511_t
MASALIKIVGACTENGADNRPCHCQSYNEAGEEKDVCMCQHALVFHRVTYLNPNTYEPVSIPSGGGHITKKTSPRNAQLETLVSHINASPLSTPKKGNTRDSSKRTREEPDIDQDVPAERKKQRTEPHHSDRDPSDTDTEGAKPASVARIGSQLAGGLKVKATVPKAISGQVFTYFTTGDTSGLPSRQQHKTPNTGRTGNMASSSSTNNYNNNTHGTSSSTFTRPHFIAIPSPEALFEPQSRGTSSHPPSKKRQAKAQEKAVAKVNPEDQKAKKRRRGKAQDSTGSDTDTDTEANVSYAPSVADEDDDDNDWIE